MLVWYLKQVQSSTFSMSIYGMFYAVIYCVIIKGSEHTQPDNLVSLLK